MIRINKLRARIVEREMTIGTVADRMGINRSTFYRKMRTGEFTVREVRSLSEILALSPSDITEIFFSSGDVA